VSKRRTSEARTSTVSTKARDENLTRIANFQDEIIAKLTAQGLRNQDIVDAFSEIFLKLAQRPELVPDEWTFSWLLVVIRHRVYSMLRKRQSHGGPPAALPENDVLSDGEPNVVDKLVKEEDEQTLFRIEASLPECIGELPLHLKRAVELVVRGGLSNREAAQLLGVHEGNVYRRMNAAVQELRRVLHRRGVLRYGQAGTRAGKYTKRINPKKPAV